MHRSQDGSWHYVCKWRFPKIWLVNQWLLSNLPVNITCLNISTNHKRSSPRFANVTSWDRCIAWKIKTKVGCCHVWSWILVVCRVWALAWMTVSCSLRLVLSASISIFTESAAKVLIEARDAKLVSAAELRPRWRVILLFLSCSLIVRGTLRIGVRCLWFCAAKLRFKLHNLT